MKEKIIIKFTDFHLAKLALDALEKYIINYDKGKKEGWYDTVIFSTNTGEHLYVYKTKTAYIVDVRKPSSER